MTTKVTYNPKYNVYHWSRYSFRTRKQALKFKKISIEIVKLENRLQKLKKSLPSSI